MIATHSRAGEDDQTGGWDWRTTSAADISAPHGDVTEVSGQTHRLHTHTHTNGDVGEFMPPHRSVF